MAARTRKAFDGACRKCGERGHKARKCRSRWKPRRSTENHSRVAEVGREGKKASARAGGHKATATTAGMSRAASTSSQEDDGDDPEVHRTSVVPQHPQPASRMVTNTTPDAANLNTTSAKPTRPEGASYNPPDQLPSTPLKGRRTIASDELRKVLVNESSITQLTWMPHDEESSREVHGVVECHEEAAEDKVKGGEVSDEEGKVETPTDETGAATTSAPSQSSMPPEGREGQDTTSNAGASVHQPLGAQTESPRRYDGAMTSARDSAQSAERADSTSADHRQQRKDVDLHGISSMQCQTLYPNE